MGPLATRLTLFVCALCIVVALPALYARSAVLDREQFADRAVGALVSDELDDEIAVRFSAGLIERSPELVTLRPALEATASDVVATGPRPPAGGAAPRAPSNASTRAGAMPW